jgi:hypothetical protein
MITHGKLNTSSLLGMELALKVCGLEIQSRHKIKSGNQEAHTWGLDGGLLLLAINGEASSYLLTTESPSDIHNRFWQLIRPIN